MFDFTTWPLRRILPRRFKILVKKVIYRDWLTVLRRYPDRFTDKDAVSLHFQPEDPRGNGFPYAILHLADHSNYRINPKVPQRRHCRFHWNDKTQVPPIQMNECTAINADCLDISKRKVDTVFEHVFGYSIRIDPTQHQGQCVEKSDENGSHDGRLIDCPIDRPREDCVYQKFIDTTVDTYRVDQMRCPIIGKEIPFILIKYKPLSAPFAPSQSGDWKEVHNCLSEHEVSLVQLFCRELGLDYGELDILRDRSDQRIYIVDANKTPTIHFEGYTRQEVKQLMQRTRIAFEKAFLSHPEQS